MATGSYIIVLDTINRWMKSMAYTPFLYFKRLAYFNVSPIGNILIVLVFFFEVLKA